jgi:adenylate cyclase
MANGLSRKLAVILHADVVSSARLVHLDETLAHERIRDTFQRFSDTIRLYNGVAHEIRGDALVAEFHMASDAVTASLAFQAANAVHVAEITDDVRPVLRVGISIGEVVVADHTVTGDGVVLAQRLEQLAEPGGVVIHGAAYETVPKRLPFDYEDMGDLELKGFDGVVKAFAVKLKPGAGIPQPETQSQADIRATDLHDEPSIAPPPEITRPAGPLHTATAGSRRGIFMLAGGAAALIIVAGIWFAFMPFSEHGAKSESATQSAAKPSIIVLPFVNRSDEAEQDYFVDGISEDIVTDLSRLSNLTVIAWNTSASYKGKTVKPQEVGKELGVGYIVDGSVRKSGDQLRITAELVDAGDGKQVWAERYDRKIADVFALQDDVTKKIVQALAIELTAAEKGQMERPATNNIAAYEIFLRGQQYFKQQTKEGNEQAREAYQRAIELDPAYARAYGGMAITLAFDFRYGWTDTPVETLDRALALAKQAVALGDNIPQTYWALGYVYLISKDYANAERAVQKAIDIAPNYADGYGLLALISNIAGKPKRAIELINKGMRLNPYYTWDYPYNLGFAYYQIGQYREAIEMLEKAQARNENALPVKLFLAASYIRAGRTADAEWVVDQVHMMSPETTIAQLGNTWGISNPQLNNAFLGDLRKAGLPD